MSLAVADTEPSSSTTFVEVAPQFLTRDVPTEVLLSGVAMEATHRCGFAASCTEPAACRPTCRDACAAVMAEPAWVNDPSTRDIQCAAVNPGGGNPVCSLSTAATLTQATDLCHRTTGATNAVEHCEQLNIKDDPDTNVPLCALSHGCLYTAGASQQIGTTAANPTVTFTLGHDPGPMKLCCSTHNSYDCIEQTAAASQAELVGLSSLAGLVRWLK